MKKLKISIYLNLFNMEIIIDIETFAGIKPPMDELVVPKTYKKEESIEKWKLENLDAEWRKQALDRFKCQVVCISINIPSKNVSETRISGSENRLIWWLSNWLQKNFHQEALGATWVSYYGNGYDIPILLLRALKYKQRYLFTSLPRKMFSARSRDLADMFRFTDKNAKASMKKLINYFGLEGKYDDLDGSKVHDMFVSRDFKTIAKYCKADVKMTLELYNILKDN